MNTKIDNNINEIDMNFSGYDEDDSFVISDDTEKRENTNTAVKTGIIINFNDDDDDLGISIKKHASNKTVEIPKNIEQTFDDINAAKSYNEIDMECKYCDDTEDTYEVTPQTKKSIFGDDDDLDYKELAVEDESANSNKQKNITIDEIEDDFWTKASKKFNNKLTEEVNTASDFKLGTAGYILPDGTYAYLDEYHGENTEYKNLGLPEFSNTHPEDDTCVRIFNEPNELQYKKLEQIFDAYLDIEGYCKVELWNDQKSYYFYKIYSLYPDACYNTGIEELVRNWKGYELVKVIKNNIKKANDNLIEEKQPSLKNILKDLQKKHSKSIKKGAMGAHFHYVGDAEKSREMFNKGIGKYTELTGDDNSDAGEMSSLIGAGDVSNGDVGASDASAVGGDGGGMGESLQNTNYNSMLKEVFDTIGFDVTKNGNGTLTAKDLYNDSNTINAKNVSELIYALQPFIETCIIIPLSTYTNQNFNSYHDWFNWYTDENKTAYPKFADEINYCDLLANHLDECEI